MAPFKLPEGNFPIKVPLSFLKRIKKRNWNDPLLLQVLWRVKETTQVENYTQDPLEEQALTKNGLLIKYPHRALWLLKPDCAIHCRYCFRKCFPYIEQGVQRATWESALDEIKKKQDLSEIILSGGDPLMATDREFEWIFNALSKIEHIKRIRIHSRMPIVLPERITDSLCNLFKSSTKKVVLVTHCNHAQEIDKSVSEAMEKLIRSKVYLLNQSVLLRNVNDSVEALSNLSERLFEVGILPYYLHQLDPVLGTAHFSIPFEEARYLMRGLWAKLPGYLVPKWVQEKPNERSKTLLSLELTSQEENK